MAPKQNIFVRSSDKEKLPLKREETFSRAWLIRGDLHAESQLYKGEEERGEGHG